MVVTLFILSELHLRSTSPKEVGRFFYAFNIWIPLEKLIRILSLTRMPYFLR